MPILWIVESPENSPYRLARTLQGEFPVRVFASIPSLVRLVRIAATPSPDACLVVLPKEFKDLKAVERRVHLFHPFSPCIFFADAEYGDSVVIRDLPLEPISQISYVRALLDLEPKPSHDRSLSYRDIVLDSERSVLRTTSDQEIGLTIKECRLLRFLIGNATQCLGRATIQAAVWGKLSVSPRTIDVHVSRLRKHLVGTGIAIENVYGGGYLLR